MHQVVNLVIYVKYRWLGGKAARNQWHASPRRQTDSVGNSVSCRLPSQSVDSCYGLLAAPVLGGGDPSTLARLLRLDSSSRSVSTRVRIPLRRIYFHSQAARNEDNKWTTFVDEYIACQAHLNPFTDTVRFRCIK